MKIPFTYNVLNLPASVICLHSSSRAHTGSRFKRRRHMWLNRSRIEGSGVCSGRSCDRVLHTIFNETIYKRDAPKARGGGHQMLS